MSTITRRSAIGLAVATALVPFIAQAGTQCLILSGGSTLNVGTGALCGIGQKFDYYISPSGDDITGAGTLASPWSITALGTMPNRATSAAKWTTYAGKRVGLIGDQGTYTQGKANGTVTMLASLMNYDGGFGPGICLYLNGGTSSAAPTYIGSSNSAGYEVPRLATVDFSSGTGNQSQIGTSAIGQATKGTDGVHYPPNWGYWTISGVVLENFSVIGVDASYNPGIGPLPGVTVQYNELKGGAGWSNDNPGAIFLNETTGCQIIGNKIHDCFSVSNAMLGSMNASISGSVLTVNSIVNGWSLTTLAVGQSIYIVNTAGTAAYATIASFAGGSGGTGTYNLTTSPGNVTAQTMWFGEDSAFPSWAYWAWTAFNSTIGPTVTGNTFYNIGICGTKDNYQGSIVSYNYFEFGEWGTWPTAPNASGSAPGSAGYQNIIAGSSQPAYIHHNIITGPNCNYLIDCFGEDGKLNEGVLTVDHNTFYSPSTNAGTPTFMRLEQSTSGSIGTAQFTNNVVWSDANSAAGWEVGACFYFPTGFTNLAFDYNALQHNVTYGTVFGTATYTGVSAWHTGTGQDAHSISLATTPFATTPVSQTPSTFQVAGAALTGSSTGGVMGALDGTGVIGCGF